MTTWYDVSDLTSWHLGHLTGIQRTVVGVLNGLVDCGAAPRLVRYNIDRRRFEPIDVRSLPAAVVRHLSWASAPETDHPPLQAEPAAAGSSSRWLSRERIFGTSPAAAELRLAFREFKHAGRHLHRKLRRWTSVRFGRHDAGLSPVVRPRRGRRTLPLPAAPPPAAGPCQPGDVLLSLSASWSIPGHAEAVAAERRRGVAAVRMIYDLIPAIKPQWVDEESRLQVTRWLRSLLTESDGILTISEFSRGEIEAYCRENLLPQPPLTVVRLGDELGSAHDQTPPLPRFVPRRPFFVCVSTLDIRKNHRLLYDAWQVLAARDPAGCPDLVCLGVPHLFVSDLLREIRQDRTVNGRIHVLSDVDDAELAWYYRNSAATIYPSRYEGWGLPVAESLGHGRLCLASNATSIPEISPDLPAFFDPFNARELVALVEKTLREPDWVREREAAIRQQFAATPWTATARQVTAAIERAVSDSGREAA